MDKVSVDIPDGMAHEIHRYVADGWFASEEELIRAAIREFLRRNRTDLVSRFHREDIAWAASQRQKTR